MSEYIINSTPEPLGNLGAMAPQPVASHQLVRPQPSQTVPGGPVPLASMGRYPAVASSMHNGYGAGSLGRSMPLSVGTPEALGAERRLPTMGGQRNRMYVTVNSAGQMVQTPIKQEEHREQVRNNQMPMGIPTFGNVGVFY